MMGDYLLFPAMTVTFAVTFVFMLVLRPVAKGVGLLDRPGGRKRHVGDIPIIGGVAMFVGLAVGLALLGLELRFLIAILMGSFLLLVVGVIDDRFAIPATPRIATQIAVVLIMVFGAHLMLTDIGDPFGTGIIALGKISLIFTMLVAVTLINAYNLIDGIDGLAGSLAFVALISVALVGGIDHPSAAIALTAAASIAAFLIFNFPTTLNRSVRSFMGDAGSTLLGFTIVWVTLGVSQGAGAVISPVHCLWFAAIPIFDSLTCFVRRVRKGKSPFAPGRDHFHHTLARGGFGVRQKLSILTGLQALYAIIGILGHFAGVPDHYMFAAWSVLGISQRYIIRILARSYRLYRWSQARPHPSLDKKEIAHT